MPKIFISYRREDSEHVTGRIYDRLDSHFGREAVFIDVDAIPLGVDFRVHLQNEVAHCDVVLAVIGESWLEIRHQGGPNEGQRRLDDPADIVRVEIQWALEKGMAVIPVLVGRAVMPTEQQLPDGLKELAYRNAAEVRSGRDFHDQVNRLIRGVEQVARAHHEREEAKRRQSEEEARLREEERLRRERKETQLREQEKEAQQRRDEEAARLQEEERLRREREETQLREQEKESQRRRDEEAARLQEEERLRRERKETQLREQEKEAQRRRDEEAARLQEEERLRREREEAQLREQESKKQRQLRLEEARREREQIRLREIEEQRRRQEQILQRQKLAEMQTSNFLRLKEDGRLDAWVESRVWGWDRLAWLALLVELKESEFWPISLKDLGHLLQEIKRDKTKANLADADRPSRERESGTVLMSSRLAIPIRGVWYSRRADEYEGEWQYEALLPGLVRVEPGRAYLYGAVPHSEDTDLARLAGMESMLQLKALQLASCERITDNGLAHVKSLLQIQSLEVNIGHMVTDTGLSHLRNLEQLRSVVLHRCYGLADSGLDLLRPLRRLESLTMWGCRLVTDAGLHHLGSLDNLVSVNLWGGRRITDVGLARLVPLTRLRSLTIYDCPEVTTDGLGVLSALGDLRELKVFRCCQIRMPDVMELRAKLPHCKITIVSAIESEVATFRRDRLAKSYRGRIAGIRNERVAQALSPQAMNLEKDESAPARGGEHPKLPGKNWWEVWK